jgi:hypothetical protein
LPGTDSSKGISRRRLERSLSSSLAPCLSAQRPLLRPTCFLAASLLTLTLADGCGGDDESPSGGSAGDDGSGDAGEGSGASVKGGTSGKGGSSGKGGTSSDGGSSSEGGTPGSDGGSGGGELYFAKLGIACEVDDDCESGQIYIAGTADDPFFQGGPAHGICTVPCSEDEDCGELADCRSCRKVAAPLSGRSSVKERLGVSDRARKLAPYWLAMSPKRPSSKRLASQLNGMRRSSCSACTFAVMLD